MTPAFPSRRCLYLSGHLQVLAWHRHIWAKLGPIPGPLAGLVQVGGLCVCPVARPPACNIATAILARRETPGQRPTVRLPRPPPTAAPPARPLVAGPRRRHRLGRARWLRALRSGPTGPSASPPHSFFLERTLTDQNIKPKTADGRPPFNGAHRNWAYPQPPRPP
jgi:hypothetical protein